MSLHRPYKRKLRLVTHPAYPEYTAFQLADGGAKSSEEVWVVQSKETGHVYSDRFANEGAAQDWIGMRFYGVMPKPTVMRAMAVRCRVGCSPAVFGQVYTAVSYDPAGFFDKLCVYIPKMRGDYRALPMDAALFDPVNPEHAPRFKHLALDGFEHVSGPVMRVMGLFDHGVITTGRALAGRAA